MTLMFQKFNTISTVKGLTICYLLKELSVSGNKNCFIFFKSMFLQMYNL